MNKKLFAVIAAAGLLFTGCGSDAPVESEPELSEPVTEATQEKLPDDTGDELQLINFRFKKPGNNEFTDRNADYGGSQVNCWFDDSGLISNLLVSEQITPFEPETLLAGKRKEFPYITDDQCFSDDVTPYEDFQLLFDTGSETNEFSFYVYHEGSFVMVSGKFDSGKSDEAKEYLRSIAQTLEFTGKPLSDDDREYKDSGFDMNCPEGWRIFDADDSSEASSVIVFPCNSTDENVWFTKIYIDVYEGTETDIESYAQEYAQKKRDATFNPVSDLDVTNEKDIAVDCWCVRSVDTVGVEKAYFFTQGDHQAIVKEIFSSDDKSSEETLDTIVHSIHLQ